MKLPLVNHPQDLTLSEGNSDAVWFAGKGGLPLAADVSGDINGVPVILLPGAGQTRHAWRKLAARLLAQGFHVISLDLRGHGESAWANDGDYSIGAFVDDLLAVLTTQQRPPILIGASIGGIASLLAVAKNSASPLVSGLVLVDVVPHMQSDGLERIRGFMTAGADGFTSVEEAADAVARYLPHRPRPKSSENLAKNLRHGLDGRWYWHWDPAFHAGSRQRTEDGMFEQMERAASSISVPTLLISGSQSEVVNSEGAARLLRLIPQATWINVQDAAHMVVGDQNDVFNAAIVDFIKHVSMHPNGPQQ